MKTKYLNVITILIVAYLSTATLFAQTSNYELGIRYIKLGNTYREANDLENALKYIEMGQKIFVKQRNATEKYWYAVALEHLGYCYRDLKQLHRAESLLKDAHLIFKDVVEQSDGSPFAVDIITTKLGYDISNSKNKNSSYCPVKCEEHHIGHSSNHITPGMPIHSHNNPTKSMQMRSPVVINLGFQDLYDEELGEYITEKRIDVMLLNDNNFEILPSAIINSFSTLLEVDLANNYIIEFPYLPKLKELRRLNLANNYLLEIGDFISELVSLEYLDLSGNEELMYISPEISKLTKLKRLDLRNTDISFNGNAIRELKSKLPPNVELLLQ